MRIVFTFLAIAVTISGMAQKKLTIVNRSEITGASLPEGSKLDKRFLYEASAKALLELQSKKTGAGIKNTEVLYLPLNAGISFEKVSKQLTDDGWSVSPIPEDPKYFWLQKDTRSIVGYFEVTKKDVQLYLGETNSQASVVNNNNTQAEIETPRTTTETTQTVTETIQQQQASINTPTSPSTNNGITISTTNFDDGWVAVPQNDWVELTRKNYRALLHFSTPLPDDLKSSDPEPVLQYYWNLVISPRYNSQSVEMYKNEPYSYPRIHFIQGEVTEKSSGTPKHVALKINIINGVASCIEVVSDSRSAFLQLFPTINSVDPLVGYNKFAITASDILGEWHQSSGGFAQYYNVYSGNYAGMYGVSIASQLILSQDGKFRFDHKGASGMAGNQTFFSEKTHGAYAVPGFWELTTTDQNGKTYTYTAFYQAVKNGKILYLQNKKYTGQEYYMVKAK